MSKIYLKKKTLPLILLFTAIPIILAYIWLSYLNDTGDEIPPIKIGNTTCSYCGMIISDLRFAAAIKVKTSEAENQIFYYDDLGCLAKHKHVLKGDIIEGWVHDSKTAQPILLKNAQFSMTNYQTPMGSGWMAHDKHLQIDQKGYNIQEFFSENISKVK